MPREKQDIIDSFRTARENLELSELVFWKTITTIKESSTHLTAEQLCTKNGAALSQKISVLRALSEGLSEYSLEWIEATGSAAKEFEVGNCCERACFAFCLLKDELIKHGLNVNLELVNNPFLDHFFVVFARNPETLLSDPSTWNEDAIICDPWKDGRSYFIGEVSFNDMSDCPWEAMNCLLPEKGVRGPLLLNREVMPIAHGLEGDVPITQEVMVLRSRFYDGEFSAHNAKIPMVYEAWDLPNSSESDDDITVAEGAGRDMWRRV